MPTVYTVDNGDTLFGIAQRFYGDGMKFPIIAQANGITNPNLIFPGQVLQIPDLAPPPPQPAPQPPPLPQPGRLRSPSTSVCCGLRTC
jgi:LysM repeat protein